jgi:hypothetical protein
MTSTLLDLIQRLGATSILCVCDDRVPAIEEFRAANPDANVIIIGHATPPTRELGRFDLSVVAFAPGRLSKSDGTRLLASLRNFHSNVVAVTFPDDDEGAKTPWSDLELLALGLEPARTVPGDTARLYVYDITAYNRQRDWNNPRHWANPENFRKYRW